MKIGNAVHTICYEGIEKFGEQYYVMPKVDKRTKEGKDLNEKLIKWSKGKNRNHGR